MTDRSDDAIRADLARASDYLAEVVATSEHSPWGAAFRLAADVAPLLARAVAAEARAEQAEARYVALGAVDAYASLRARVRELETENANLRESAETAVFAANNIGESYRLEVERREDANLHADVLRNDLAAERARVAELEGELAEANERADMLDAARERWKVQCARDEARSAALHALFNGGPDTACRTVWQDGIECVSVPINDLRAALAAAPRHDERLRESMDGALDNMPTEDEQRALDYGEEQF